MKKSFWGLILTLIVLISAMGSYSVCANAANGPIKVYIDGEKISFDVNPEIVNGRTMVPMRKIFEYFGAEVEWYNSSRTIRAECGGCLYIEMQINNDEMHVNTKPISLDSPPIIKDGRTLVPLRAVAEVFSAKVEWIESTRTVHVKTLYPRNAYKNDEETDNKHIKICGEGFEYLDFLIEGNAVTITGATFADENILQVGAIVRDANEYPIMVFNDNFPPSRKANITAVENSTFLLSVDCSSVKISTSMKMDIYKQASGGDFWGVFDVILEKTVDGYSFVNDEIWENNKAYMSKWVNPIVYIHQNIDNEIINLSNNICKDADNDYDKILMIHDWVADNIYYDYDYYYNKSSDIAWDALEVYKSKRSVCAGYADLTQDLINAQGIPCRVIQGYALGLGEAECWNKENVSIKETNHAWNQAYVDNRWVNIDTTWDSNNTYENGEFLHGGRIDHEYFDISDVFFSRTHKYLI